jgi:hypothetical protein
VREFIGRHTAETAILLLGLLAGLLEGVFVEDTSIALVIVLMSLLLSIAVLSIRDEVEVQVRSVSDTRSLIASIPDGRWRQAAEDELAHLHTTLEAWSCGTRRVADRGSLQYQIAALAGCSMSVDAIHLALEEEALDIWLSPGRGFQRLVEAYRTLSPSVTRRRVLVLPGESEDGASTVGAVDGAIADFCDRQVAAAQDGGLGFDLRLLWLAPGRRDVGDILIIDRREVCSIESLGHGRFTDLEVSVAAPEVGVQVNHFERVWIEATPFVDVDRVPNTGAIIPMTVEERP